MRRVKVTKKTRAPEGGRVITAPCGYTERVYHFAWTALRCRGCDRDHEKTDYETEGTAA